MHDHYHNVTFYASLSSLMKRLGSGGEEVLAVDIETTGLDPYEPGAEVVSLSLTAEDEETWVVPLWHPEGPWQAKSRNILRDLAQMLSIKRLVAHNANFDLHWIRRITGVDLSDALFWDTQSAAHLLNENQSKRLKSLASHLVGDWGIDVKNAWLIDWYTLAPYNAWDTIATLRLMKEQQGVLRDYPVLHDLLINVVLPAQRVLLRTSQRGIAIDTAETRRRLRDSQHAAYTAEHWLEHHAMSRYDMDLTSYPTRSWASQSKMFLDFAERAVEEGHLMVRETTPKGNVSWRSGVLRDIAREEQGEAQQIAEALLSLRDGQKKAQFCSAWLDAARDVGRIHANFNNSRTVTGRLSSSDPNMQQVDRDLKDLFVPRLGRMFCEIDWSQIELRVIAEMIHRSVLPGNPMMQAFRSGADLHSIAATLVTGGRTSEVSKEDRQKGKAINFGFAFGMGAENFVKYARETYGVDFTLSEARRVRDGFFSTWDGLSQWHQWICEVAMDQGYVETLSGRRRRLPNVFSPDSYERSEALRQAINSPVQGTASDLMMAALPRIEQTSGVLIVGTVHDSALMEVTGVEAADSAACAMLEVGIGYEVPLEVEVGIGPRWTQYEHVFTRST